MKNVKRKLPAARQLSENRKLPTPEGHNIHLTISYDPGNPLAPVAVFYSGGLRSGSDLEYQMQDLCILVSLLLQSGASLDELSKSLSTRDPLPGQSMHGSLVGRIVESLKEPPSWDGATRDASGEPLLPGFDKGREA